MMDRPLLTSELLNREFQQPHPLGVEIARRLEAEIILLRRRPGSRLGEEEVSGQFQVSRSPVREALRSLEVAGLVERAPRRGGIVTPMSVENLDAICACRVPLEGLAAANVAAAAEARTIASIQEAIERMEAADHRGDPEDAFWANAGLTELLHARCGNPVLQRLLDSVNKQALRYRYYTYRESPDFVAAAAAGNRDLLAAIAQSDPEAARRVTEHLVRKSWDLTRRLLTERQLSVATDTA